MKTMAFILIAFGSTSCNSSVEGIKITEEQHQLALLGKNSSNKYFHDEFVGVDAYYEYTPQAVPLRNAGLTSANVRLYLVDNEKTPQWYPAYRLIDLNQLENYHEFVATSDGFQIVFTTEKTVYNFRFLDIRWNDNFFENDINEFERLYSVHNVIYSLERLTAESPLLVVGANLGCALAVNGFSFEDEYGETNYFSFLQSGKTGLIEVGEF